ncbi:MAG: SRPBCC family protein, partial [Miltoncostaeaceae bacterium]
AQVEQSITVAVPVATAYNQWTQFEEFPQFMEGVDEVRQLDDTNLRWTVTVAGRQQSFDARITEQIPDTRVAWTSTDGPKHGGAVDFHRLDDDHTQVMVVMDGPDDTMPEKAAGAMGLVERRVKGDLERFKEFIEARGVASGAWRGSVAKP